MIEPPVSFAMKKRAVKEVGNCIDCGCLVAATGRDYRTAADRLKRLPPKYRCLACSYSARADYDGELVSGLYLAGARPQQIATYLELPRETVRTILRRRGTQMRAVSGYPGSSPGLDPDQIRIVARRLTEGPDTPA